MTGSRVNAIFASSSHDVSQLRGSRASCINWPSCNLRRGVGSNKMWKHLEMHDAREMMLGEGSGCSRRC
jgi:hypothetical protein